MVFEIGGTRFDNTKRVEGSEGVEWVEEDKARDGVRVAVRGAGTALPRYARYDRGTGVRVQHAR